MRHLLAKWTCEHNVKAQSVVWMQLEKSRFPLPTPPKSPQKFVRVMMSLMPTCQTTGPHVNTCCCTPETARCGSKHTKESRPFSLNDQLILMAKSPARIHYDLKDEVEQVTRWIGVPLPCRTHTRSSQSASVRSPRICRAMAGSGSCERWRFILSPTNQIQHAMTEITMAPHAAVELNQQPAAQALPTAVSSWQLVHRTAEQVKG